MRRLILTIAILFAASQFCNAYEYKSMIATQAALIMIAGVEPNPPPPPGPKPKPPKIEKKKALPTPPARTVTPTRSYSNRSSGGWFRRR